ncbi:MND1-interacting protein 1-like [Andrographis paniculata]|uniref:MND1-interacting protein 1-like n=1 Tax=Andrographis paniculata TaxID=175694 RepID=UPI0021E8CD31|nr:MND1-interacting protein 1-like [Andrographis paniculata]
MAGSAREKHIRANRRSRAVKPESDRSSSANNNVNLENSGSTKIGNNTKNPQPSLSLFSQNPASVSDTDPNAVFDDNGWGYCTEEQLEEILLKNLEFLYTEAINKLIGLGYSEEVALKAILRNGHCYGGMDVLTNILHNSLAYLNSSGDGGGSNEEPNPSFSDLKQLEEYSLQGMVCLLQQVKPHLSRGDAMWCLLMSDLHVGRASVMEIPVLPSPNGGGSGSGSGGASTSDSGSQEGGITSGGPVGVAPSMCRFHGGWGFGNSGTSEFPMSGANGFLSYASEMTLQREIECPKRFNISPSMKDLLKRNVAMFAAGFKANSKKFNSQSQACPSSLSVGNSPDQHGTPAAVSVGHGKESHNVKKQDVVNSVMSKFRELNLDENLEQASADQKDEMILTLIHQLRELDKQVKERKEWAHQKAMQAARKLSHDLTELKTLRMEREETQRLRKGKQALEETSAKRIAEMENALRIANTRVDRANAAVRKLEIENAEIRAEMEASKLSASESVATCLEVAKREKKCLKKLLAWEKQKSKMQEDIASEKQKLAELQRELAQTEAATKKMEAKYRQEQKNKEQALAQLEEEQRLKEASEVNNKRRLEAVRLKIEINFQRHKDDLQRLEQEYARLKESAQAQAENQSDQVWTANANGIPQQGESIARLLHELDQLENSQEKKVSSDRDCILCRKDEVSVVFLPCTHQVICANCNDNYGKKGKAACPYCRVPIEQRIRVYGASS